MNAHHLSLVTVPLSDRVEWGKTNQRGKTGQLVNLSITSQIDLFLTWLVFTMFASMRQYPPRSNHRLLLHVLQLQQRFSWRPIFSQVEGVKLILDLQKNKHII